MTPNGFDAASDARFRATVEIEIREFHKQIDLLWRHNRKRAAEIEAVKSRINGTIYSLLCATLGIIAVLLKPKLGF